jgi:hypothetical protein
VTDIDEEYRGDATLRVGDQVKTVTVRLSARFEPVEGRYRWAGRTGPDEDLLAYVRTGVREVVLLVGGGPVTTARLSEPDPWGGVRLSGTGRPPWVTAGVTADPAATSDPPGFSSLVQAADPRWAYPPAW